MLDIETELQQYIETALWSTNADHLDPEGTGHAGNLQAHFDASDLAPETLESMRLDVDNFMRGIDPQARAYWLEHLGAGQLGHDFWLTRNGHGAGFWDRFHSDSEGGRYGAHLTSESKPYGSSDLYVGDDNQLYVS